MEIDVWWERRECVDIWRDIRTTTPRSQCPFPLSSFFASYYNTILLFVGGGGRLLLWARRCCCVAPSACGFARGLANGLRDGKTIRVKILTFGR
eukprot:scaffold3342_cov174-Amphora_coffeaeformis.AAC.4